MPPVKSGRKNKRGERGSTDDETTESKRVNMASAMTSPEGRPLRINTEDDLDEL